MKILFQKGHTLNNGRKHTEETKMKISLANKGGNKTSFKIGQNANEKNHLWKGSDVSYSGLHYWVSRKLGKPAKCEQCESTDAKRYEWANKSGKYKRDLTDWIRLCASCHKTYDEIWLGRERSLTGQFI